MSVSIFPSSFTYFVCFVSAVDPPTELAAPQVDDTFKVYWTPPSPTPYGYRVSWQGGSVQGSEVVVGGSATSHQVTVAGHESGVSYTISVQTLSSSQLPSEVATVQTRDGEMHVIRSP